MKIVELSDKELLEIEGGYHDDGSGNGCIPNPFIDILKNDKQKF